MTTVLDEFAERVLAAVPAAHERYEAVAAQCREEGLDEATPEIFLARYSGDVLRGFAADPASWRAQLTDLAAVLEHEFGRDPEVDSVIDFAFLSQFPGSSAHPDPAQYLGPKLRPPVQTARDWRAAPGYMDLVHQLLAAVPALQRWAQENTYGDHQDVLIHTFFGDVLAWLTEEVEAGRTDEARAVIDVLEQACTGSLAEPIASGFVEGLPEPGEDGQQILEFLGPRLRAQLALQRDG
ncbi:DUF7674 family protein [Kineosporia babensis]|uniref:DUF7674 domain-containing protein n=1 Tax=Kineosporia babensis TaxID=499548 RepID=A0A9X1SSA8_9ACTN|nr:hypothetical protein [Kineosporia babensis]MCD5310467.1 hypothetical protein [Kineosporia babensis]